MLIISGVAKNYIINPEKLKQLICYNVIIESLR